MPVIEPLRLHFKKEGSGLPLVILHGLFGSLDNWATLSKRYAENYTVYTIDARNHGRSPQSNDITYEAMAADLNRLLDDEQLKKVHLMGHSMGGKTAMFFAGAWPGKLFSLTVADIGPGRYPVTHQTIIDALLGTDLVHAESRNQVNEQLKKSLPDESVRQFLMKGLYRLPENSGAPFGWRFNVKAIADGIEKVGVAVQKGVKYNGPVLFLKGENSGYIRQEDIARIHDHFPQAEIHVIKNAGHWLHAENPEAYYDETMRFLSANSPD